MLVRLLFFLTLAAGALVHAFTTATETGLIGGAVALLRGLKLLRRRRRRADRGRLPWCPVD